MVANNPFDPRTKMANSVGQSFSGQRPSNDFLSLLAQNPRFSGNRSAGVDYADIAGEPEKSWWQHALTPITEGPIGAALSAYGTAHAGIMSTLKEGVDFLQGEGFSGSDWKEQVGRRYGFGDLWADEGADLGKWGNRVVGLIGDVAFDPMTYMTMGSSALAKIGAKEVADQLMKAGHKQAATRITKSGSKLAAGGKALRDIGYDVGLSFNLPGTGVMGRAMGMDKVMDAVTGGLISSRRMKEWAPVFARTAGEMVTSPAAQKRLINDFNKAVRLGRNDARELLETTARELGEDLGVDTVQVALGGTPVTGFAREALESTADDLLDVVSRAQTSRVNLFWNNGKPSYGLPFMKEGDNRIIQVVASAPGRGFNWAVGTKIGQHFSKRFTDKKVLTEWLQSGDPLKYFAARSVEEGSAKGYANRGKWLGDVDRKQTKFFNLIHEAGFDISATKPGAVGEALGQTPTGAMSARANSARILQDAMEEPWLMADGTQNPNLSEFINFVEANGKTLDQIQELHAQLILFEEMGASWEQLAKSSVREGQAAGERYVTRRMTPEAHKAAKRQRWYKDRDVANAARVGERIADTADDTGVHVTNAAKRDTAYAVNERVFEPGMDFTWGEKKVRQGFEILEPGTAGPAGPRTYTHAPSVRKQIENFIADVDPVWARENTFFDTDLAKLIDGYKQAMGREMIYMTMTNHLAAKGILLDKNKVGAVNELLDDMFRNTKAARKSQTKMGKQAAKKTEYAEAAAARARNFLDDAGKHDVTAKKLQQQADDLGEGSIRQTADDINELDAKIAQMQRSLMNMDDEMDVALEVAATGTTRTAGQATTDLEDLLAMSFGVESVARLSRLLDSIGSSIRAEADIVSGKTVLGAEDLTKAGARKAVQVRQAYKNILEQVQIAQELLQVVKNKAVRLGGLDKNVQDLEALITALGGKSFSGFARKNAGPKYIRHYVEQVEEVGRLADELEAAITFNSGWRRPLTPEDIFNRKWAKETQVWLSRNIDLDVRNAQLNQKLGTEPLITGSPLYKNIIEAEAERITKHAALADLYKQSNDLTRKAAQAMKAANTARVNAARTTGDTAMGMPRPYTKQGTLFQWQAEALDLEAARATAEAKFLTFDEAVEKTGAKVIASESAKKWKGPVNKQQLLNPLDEVMIDDIKQFQDAENMFADLLKAEGPNSPIKGLIAGFQDGMLPFGPVYADNSRMMAAMGGTEINEQLIEMMSKTVNAGEKEVGNFLRVWDSMTGYFKAQAVARPAFIQRNGLGGLFNNLIAGMDMSNAVRFIKLRGQAINAGWEDALREAGLAEDLGRGATDFLRTKPGYLKQRAAELGAKKLNLQGKKQFRDISRVYESGAVGAGQAAAEVAQSFRMSGATTFDRYGRPMRWNPLRRDNVWNTAIRNGNMEMEEILRGSLAFDSLRTGMSPVEAIMRVNKYHFNYSKDAMTDWERKFAARALPFYTWTRNSVPLMATEMLRQPRSFYRYLQVKQNIELGVEKDRTVPAWYGKRWGIDLSGLMGNPNQGARSFAFPDLPFMDLIEFTDMPSRDRPFGGLTRIAESLAPQVKTPIEMLTGTSMFRNIPISDEYIKPPAIFFDMPGLMPFLDKMPGNLVAKNTRGKYGIRESTVYSLQSFIPYIAQVRRMLPREERYKDKVLSSWLSWILPIGYRGGATVVRDVAGARYRRVKDRDLNKAEWRSLERIR